MTTRLENCRIIADIQKLAQRNVPGPIYDTISAGTGQEITRLRNTAAFDEIRLVPRVGFDVSKIDMRTTVLGKPVSFPLMVAPTGVIGIIHPKSELAIAGAASDAGIMYALSTYSTSSLESVAAAGAGPRVFQLYLMTDEGLTEEMLQSAKAAKYDALCITVDTTAKVHRKADRWKLAPGVRPPFRTLLELGRHPVWMYHQVKLAKVGLTDVARRANARGIETPLDFYDRSIRVDVTWKDIERVARQWNGPVAVKGILRPEDAKRAVDAGATAIVVCNHGGTQLDGAPASISMVPDIVDAVGPRIEVIQCGGLRHGDGILKAIALGAKAVMTGRPFLFGVAAAGKTGVAKVIEILRRELEVAMTMSGYASIGEISRAAIRNAPAP